nr:PAS domain S-box protein [Natrialba sp. INN-245]
MLSATGEILGVTESVTERTGYSAEDLRGTPLASILLDVPDALEAVTDRGVGNDGDAGVTPTSCSLAIRTADGDVAAFDGRLERLPRDGTDDVVVGTLHWRPRSRAGGETVPERDEETTSNPGWQAQNDEVAPPKTFVALADALQDGIIVLDTDSEIQYANPAVERILGYGPRDLVGESKLSVIPERLQEQHLNALNRYLETGERNIDWEYVELPGQHEDGHEVPLGISLNDFVFDDERYFVGLFRDITPRQEAERALRERERQLEEYREYTDDILNAIDDVFYVLDSAGKLKRWNHRLCEVAGYSDEEIASMHALEFFEEREHEAIANAIQTGFDAGSARVEATVVTKDGETIPYEFVAASLEDPDGNLVLAGIGRDITTRIEQRQELEESNERLEQFAYAASHDLQEPLRMVTSYLQLIEGRYADELDDDAEEFLEFAVDGAERMREMIDGLLAYSRVDTQGDSFEPIDLDAVLEDVLDDLQLKVDASGAAIDAEPLPQVLGDRSQLRQVIQNLLSNAIEYSGDEPPTIEITAERDGDEWRITVDDDGIGIDPSKTDRIFQVFQRLHMADEHDGTGIGLALTRRIVERHGGRIWVDSEPDGGSTFFVTLPATSSLESPSPRRSSR